MASGTVGTKQTDPTVSHFPVVVKWNYGGGGGGGVGFNGGLFPTLTTAVGILYLIYCFV